jgi:hypothetical protein
VEDQGRPNPKSEIRNAKQIRITKEENPKQVRAKILDFGFVSDIRPDNATRVNRIQKNARVRRSFECG